MQVPLRNQPQPYDPILPSKPAGRGSVAPTAPGSGLGRPEQTECRSRWDTPLGAHTSSKVHDAIAQKHSCPNQFFASQDCCFECILAIEGGTEKLSKLWAGPNIVFCHVDQDRVWPAEHEPSSWPHETHDDPVDETSRCPGCSPIAGFVSCCYHQSFPSKIPLGTPYLKGGAMKGFKLL